MHFSCLVFLTPNVLIPSDQNMSQQAKYSNTFKLYTTDISQIGIASEEKIFKTKYMFSRCLPLRQRAASKVLPCLHLGHSYYFLLYLGNSKHAHHLKMIVLYIHYVIGKIMIFVIYLVFDLRPGVFYCN